MPERDAANMPLPLAQLLANDLGVVAAAWAPGQQQLSRLGRGDGPAQRARPRLQRHDGAGRLRDAAAPHRRRPLPGQREFPALALQPDLGRGQCARLRRRTKRLFRDRPRPARRPRPTQTLAAKLAAGFERAEAALAAMDAPYERFLAPPSGSAERADRRGCGARAHRSCPRSSPGRATGSAFSSSSRNVARTDDFLPASGPIATPGLSQQPRRRRRVVRRANKGGISMLIRSLIALATLAMASTALAQDITPVADFTTDKANDFRGLAYGADGKIYVSGHRGDPRRDQPQTVVVVGRFNADGTPDTSFSEDGFAEVDLARRQGRAVARRRAARQRRCRRDGERHRGGRRHLDLSRALRCHRPAGHRRAWGGETGAVEVVFGWPNANNDAFPGVEKPAAGHRVGPQGRHFERRRRSSSSPATARPPKARAAPMPTVTSCASSPPTAASIPTFNGGKPFTYHSAQAFNEGGRRVDGRGRRLDRQRRLHQSRRHAAQPRDPDPPQPRRHARPEFRRLRHAAVFGRCDRPHRDAGRRGVQHRSSATAALPNATPP